MHRILLLRHGATEWSRTLRHTGRTDVPLDTAGAAAAAALAPALATERFALVLCSPLARATRTAELAGLAPFEVDPDLLEWDYGAYEGQTTAQVRAERPGWDLWVDGVPPGPTPGESPAAVGERADRALGRIRAALADGDVAVVAHGHLLRVLTARWLSLPASDGRLFALDAAGRSWLGYEHDREVIRRWNEPPASG